MLIDSEPAQMQRLEAGLLSAGHEVTVTPSALHGLMIARASRPDLVITDLVLLDGSGMEVTVRLSRAGIPVMVTGRADAETEISVLRMGAVAYLARPFELPEVLARVAVEVGKCPVSSRDVLVVGELMLGPQWRMLLVGKKQLHLSAREHYLLDVLMREPGRVFSAEELVESAWGMRTNLGTRKVAASVSSLRRKIRAEGASGYLKTVRGVGYVMRDRD